MPPDLIVPAVVMSLALVFYTTGVIAERAQHDLRWWHAITFWLGLTCDGYATTLMNRLAAAGQDPGVIHSITGTAAFTLMAVHATWATWVLLRGSRRSRERFHRYSIVVWAVWLVPYLGGMIAGIMRGVGG
ncbi:MAG: HsmA family protein [Coriobacteriia bacterium]